MYADNAKQPAPETTLGTRFDGHLQRLYEIVIALNSLADMVHGPTPSGTAAGGSAGQQGRPISSMASRVRDLGESLDAVEGTIRRIANGL